MERWKYKNVNCETSAMKFVLVNYIIGKRSESYRKRNILSHFEIKLQKNNNSINN